MNALDKKEMSEEFDRFVVSVAVWLIRMDTDMYLESKSMLISEIQEDSELTSNQKEKLLKFMDIIFAYVDKRRLLLIETKG